MRPEARYGTRTVPVPVAQERIPATAAQRINITLSTTTSLSLLYVRTCIIDCRWRHTTHTPYTGNFFPQLKCYGCLKLICVMLHENWDCTTLIKWQASPILFLLSKILFQRRRQEKNDHQ